MTEASPHQQLDGMMTGYWILQAIYAAAKFSIADHLNNGPRSVDELAEATSTNADACPYFGLKGVRRPLRACAADPDYPVRIRASPSP